MAGPATVLASELAVELVVTTAYEVSTTGEVGRNGDLAALDGTRYLYQVQSS